MQRKTILLSAYSCAPDAGSEQGIGWNWAQSIAATGQDLVVITRAVNRTRIECHGRKTPANLEFVFHDLPAPLQAIYKLPLGNYLYYILWQYTAAKRAAELHRTKHFDQVQHITWGSFRAASFMGELGIPFTFGPVGGGEDTPWPFRKGLGWRGRMWDQLRRLSNDLLALDPLMRATYSSATEILATTRETLEKIPPAYRVKARVQPAAGIDFSHPSFGRAKQPSFGGGTLRMLYVGRLLPWKGLHLALKSLAMLGPDREAVRLTVIGTGHDEARLRRMAARLRVSENVEWIPWMSREELLRILPDFDLFLFPSFHDSGGMAVLEALRSGLPVICLDLGGPAIFVDETCGRVACTSTGDERAVVEQIAGFISELRRDPNKLQRLAHGARGRANAFAWDAYVRAVYGECLISQAV